MNKTNSILFGLLVIVLAACHTAKRAHYHHDLYRWGAFNIDNAYRFVQTLDTITAVKEISIIDTYADGDDFTLNRQWIFIDTSQPDMPNHYSYIKRAREIQVQPDTLLQLLNTFYKIGVNEFRYVDAYGIFQVAVGLTTERGYVYDKNGALKVGDSIRGRAHLPQHRLHLVKQLDAKWYEYEDRP